MQYWGSVQRSASGQQRSETARLPGGYPDAGLSEKLADGGPAGVGPQDEPSIGMAGLLGCKRLVSPGVIEHGMTMDAGFMGEHPIPDHRLIGCQGPAGRAGHKAA